MKTHRSLVLVVFLVVAPVLIAAAQQSTEDALKAARAEAAAGRTDSAVQRYRELLQQDPQNAPALWELSGLLQANGRLHEAVPVLEALVKLEPHDALALYQLGRIKSWQAAEQRADAVDLLHRACQESGNNLEYCNTYADVLSWKPETKKEAIASLQSTLATHPEATASRIKLAQLLSWSDETRPQALQLYEQGLQMDPKNQEMLLASAEMMSWQNTTRPEALTRYDRVLVQNPNETRALEGKAQLLVWRGRSGEALGLYQRVLAHDPKDPTALRGEAEIMNRKGQYARARDLAERAHTGNPSDPKVNLEIARANLGLNNFSAAKQAITDAGGNLTPEFDDVRQQVRRGLGTYVELGYAFRQQPNQTSTGLEFHRFDVAVSTPVGQSSRVTFLYQPTLYDNHVQGFNSNYFGAILDSTLSDRVTTHVQAGAEVFSNFPVNVDASAGIRFKPIPSTVLKFSFQRAAIQESQLSTQGQKVAGIVLGQASSNLAETGISYENSAHKYDLSLDYTDGVYTGQNLASNRRFGIEAQAGKSLHGDAPYIRVAYDVTYISFDHDADIQFGQPLTPQTGGYFSPTRYLLNQGVLNISHNFRRNVQWGMTGAAGVQNVENTTSVFSNNQFASSFETHLLWRVTPSNEIRTSYDYLNVFNAFERNLYRVSWRHYF